MADPIVEQIAQEIESRCGNVTGLTVVRPTRFGAATIKNGLALIQQQEPTADESFGQDGVQSGNPAAQAWVQIYLIQLFSRQSETDTTAAETLVNRLWADVVKAITRQGETDADSWHTFGGVAINSAIGSPSLGVWETDAATAVIEFKVAVQYRTNENDPYTAR